MTRTPVCIKSNQFTIYDDYNASIPEFKLKLYSVWNVARETTYTARRDENLGDNFFGCFRTISGKATITTVDGTFLMKPHDLIIVKYKDIIKYSALEGIWEYTCYNFYVDQLPVDQLPFFELNTTYNIPMTILENETNQEMFSLMNFYNEINILLTDSLFHELYLRWIKYYNDKKIFQFPHYNEILNIVDYIERNISEIEHIDELAKKCYLSPRQFRTIFKQMTGESPKSYICKLKLKKVASLLITTTMNLNAIAIEMKYSSPFQMSRDFKKLFGMSPKQYREKSQQ